MRPTISAHWCGMVTAEYASLIDINKHADVKVGQTVVTSSYSTIFPENIPLGKVLKVDYDEGGNFYMLKVKLTTNFTNLTSYISSTT